VKGEGNSRRVWVLIVSALLVGLSVWPGFSATPQQRPQGNQWKMVYQAGAAPIQKDAEVLVTISRENLVLQAKKGSPFSITPAGITAVSSNLFSRHTASLEQAVLWADLARFNPYTLMFLPFGIAGMAATYPITSRYAYVSILWSDNGTEQEILLKLNRAEYAPFLASLRQATGKEWRNLDTEWEKVRQQLKNEENRKISVHLTNRIRILKSDLKPGDYQLVLLGGDANHGEVYFFPRNQVNVEHLLAVALVEIQPLEGEATADPVSYMQDKNGVAAISAIRTDSKTLRFP
jgi:hypothetical protein